MTSFMASPVNADLSSTTPARLHAFEWQIENVGDRCLLVRLGDKVSVQTSRIVHSVTAALSAGLRGLVLDVVPAFTTVAVHFQPALFPRQQGPASAQVARKVTRILDKGVELLASSGRILEVPTCYGGDYGPDLIEVARYAKLTPQEVIDLHSSTPLTVYAYFFSPGNPFAGPLDARLTIPRRNTPRTLVPAGSIGIAGGISSIYQNASPGGWNLIGRTPLSLFDLHQMPPTPIQPGEQIHFRPVSPEQFESLWKERT